MGIFFASVGMGGGGSVEDEWGSVGIFLGSMGISGGRWGSVGMGALFSKAHFYYFYYFCLSTLHVLIRRFTSVDVINNSNIISRFYCLITYVGI